MKNIVGLLKANWEKFLVIFLMLGVTLVSAFLVTKMREVEQLHLGEGELDFGVIRTKKAEPYDGAIFREIVRQLDEPLQVPIDQGTDHRTFISAEYVTCVNPTCLKPIPYEALSCPFCGAPQPPLPPKGEKDDRDRDGIPDADEVKLGLDPYNPADAAGDQDGDGFTNLEEYNWKTDLNDPGSRPPLAAKLRWYQIIREPFILRFKGVQELPGGRKVFQINLGDLRQTFFGKIGDTVRGYRIMDYEEKISTDDKGEKIDESILTVQNIEDEAEVYHLVKGRVVQKEEFTADLLLFTPPYRTYRKQKIGGVLMVGTDKYVIVDITGASVTIQDERSGEKFKIPQYVQPRAGTADTAGGFGM